MTAKHVAVIGGGLAGIAAALRCADAGCAVDLFEARPALGGLTTSFRRGDLHVDNGQHVFLRCCTEYRSLLDRLGVADSVVLQDKLAIPVRTPGVADDIWLRRNGMPPPLHLAESLLGYRPLPLLDRFRLGPATLALKGVDVNDPANDDQSFADWLDRHGQSEAAIRGLWELISLPTMNVRAAQSSLAQAAFVFQRGLLTDAAASDIGWPLVPLARLHGEPARQRLAEAGARVHTGVKVRGISALEQAWQVLSDVDTVACDQVIVAVPPLAAEQLLPPGALDLPSGWSQRLGSSPIVNVHVIVDRPVMRYAFLAAVHSPVQWVFDRTVQSGLPSGQYLAVSLSAADEEIELPTGVLRERLLPELKRVLPGLQKAEVRDFFVTRERHATFRPAPGSAALRPGPVTRAPGLFVAGAWTATGWPATMEGAVRSGYTAAGALLRSAHGAGAGIVEPAAEGAMA